MNKSRTVKKPAVDCHSYNLRVPLAVDRKIRPHDANVPATCNRLLDWLYGHPLRNRIINIDLLVVKNEPKKQGTLYRQGRK